MPKFAHVVEISEAEAVAKLREHLAAEKPPKPPEFRRGDIVRLDNGWIGIVSGYDEGEETTYAYYLDDEGKIGGPAFGYTLTKLEV